MPTKYDLAIIGSGGGAFAAAIRASTLGKSVVMIERGTLGGTCVNTGCVPSKALIAAAGARHVAVDAATRFPGIATTADPVDMPALIAGKQALVESLRGEKYADVADSYGWQVLRGDASFVGTPDAPVLDVAGADRSVETIEAHHYLVATGSRPWAPPIDGLEETGYLTSTTAMELTEVPESLLVLGGGYIALEQAQLFARLGSQVTLLVRSRLASKEEPEVSKALQEVFADEGIRVVSRAVPTRASRGTGGEAVVTAAVSGGSQEFRADQVLVALGRRPVTDGLNLDAVGMTEKDVLAAGIRCDCRVLPLHHVPRALVNRDTRGFIKIVVNAETNEILGLTAVAKDAGELAAAGVHVLGRTVAEIADAWAPYLTMAEGIRIAAKAFTTDPSLLSCCA